jgi:hypothetical protein
MKSWNHAVNAPDRVEVKKTHSDPFYKEKREDRNDEKGYRFREATEKGED